MTTAVLVLGSWLILCAGCWAGIRWQRAHDRKATP